MLGAMPGTSIRLIHWRAAEAEERAKQLRSKGYSVDLQTSFGPAELRALGQHPPGLVVIDLGRAPSQGLAVGLALRQQKATRLIPLVFVEGDPQKTERVRRLLPDAFFTPWSRIARAVEHALRHRSSAQVAPGIMADYSGTPLARKLGIRPQALVALAGAPKGFEDKLEAVPAGARLVRGIRGRPRLILLFVKSKADLGRRFPAAARALDDGGGLWIIWPKKTSAIAGDLGQQQVRDFGLAAGFVDYKICAIDETWSGLLFARRKS
jgi:CheY-like chemotaxis protein